MQKNKSGCFFLNTVHSTDDWLCDRLVQVTKLTDFIDNDGVFWLITSTNVRFRKFGMFVFTVGTDNLRKFFPALKFLKALIFLIAITFLTR